MVTTTSPSTREASETTSDLGGRPLTPPAAIGSAAGSVERGGLLFDSEGRRYRLWDVRMPAVGGDFLSRQVLREEERVTLRPLRISRGDFVFITTGAALVGLGLALLLALSAAPVVSIGVIVGGLTLLGTAMLTTGRWSHTPGLLTMLGRWRAGR